MITSRGKIQILLSHTTALSWGVSSGKSKTTSTNPKFITYGKHGLHWSLTGIRKKFAKCGNNELGLHSTQFYLLTVL